MIKPDEKIIRAILNLHGDVSWMCIIEWISNSLINQSVDNNKNSGEMSIKGQGRNLELIDLLNHIKKAPEYLKNLKKSEKMEG